MVVEFIFNKYNKPIMLPQSPTTITTTLISCRLAIIASRTLTQLPRWWSVCWPFLFPPPTSRYLFPATPIQIKDDHSSLTLMSHKRRNAIATNWSDRQSSLLKKAGQWSFSTDIQSCGLNLSKRHTETEHKLSRVSRDAVLSATVSECWLAGSQVSLPFMFLNFLSFLRPP